MKIYDKVDYKKEEKAKKLATEVPVEIPVTSEPVVIEKSKIP